MIKDKIQLVFGASLKAERYSNKAIKALMKSGYTTIGIGGRSGEVYGVEILTGHPELENVHTITMYMGAQRQEEHIEYILSLNPARIIFNPGAENPKLEQLAQVQEIEVIRACTLVMLSTGQY